MKLFQNSLNDIDSIIKRNNSRYSHFDVKNTIALNENLKKGLESNVPAEENKVIAKANYNELESLFGIHKYSYSEPFIGPHPDFSHLEHNQYLNHYAVSMFMDIKGSTLLSKKYDLLQIRQIKDTILTLAIQVCSFFGGHVQRLQGDGIFLYFVKKDLHEIDAIVNALNAASLLTFYMKYELPGYFKDEDIQPPKVRIGIDYGNAEQTIWSYYGLSYCRELTTTSLHTDLAAKLQARAENNGIRIGDNIVSRLDLQAILVSKIPEEEYIFDNTYRQWKFDWEKYLLSFDFIKLDSNRNLVFEKPRFRLKCEIGQTEDSEYFEYNQNLYSIPKGYKIRFTLMDNGKPYHLNSILGEHLEWEIVNTGKEAAKAKKLREKIEKGKDSNVCAVNAEFLGHHEMQCKIVRKGGNINVRFPVFVQ